MTKNFKSTRGGALRLDLCHAILKGLSDDGGLFLPDFPLTTFSPAELQQLSQLDYAALATEIIGTFADDALKGEIADACRKAYAEGAFPADVVPVRAVGDIHIAELFHGATAAFKDMALSLLPHLMQMALRHCGDGRKIMILTATSGDTGKAALEGFSDVPDTRIVVFYPAHGVSPVQQQQMVSTQGANVSVVAINGNFDDAQTAVKAAFKDEALARIAAEKGYFLSSANSINIGRLLPQIVYYFHSYFCLVRTGRIAMGDAVNFCVPSGNFGNCLAGVIARTMGLPVSRFIVASNRNNVLTDFFRTGSYDVRRDFYTTNAPAMDILVSSNLERLLALALGEDTTRSKMQALADQRSYTISPEALSQLQSLFHAGWMDEDEVLQAVRQCYEATGYLLDTHTAVGYGVAEAYRRDTGDATPCILLSTASPYKFARDVYGAISGQSVADRDAIDALHELTSVDVPTPLQDIFERPVRFRDVIDRADIVSSIAAQFQ